jgi:hypothetical protein
LNSKLDPPPTNAKEKVESVFLWEIKLQIFEKVLMRLVLQIIIQRSCNFYNCCKKGKNNFRRKLAMILNSCGGTS